MAPRWGDQRSANFGEKAGFGGYVVSSGDNHEQYTGFHSPN
jgi:hypothetical protein